MQSDSGSEIEDLMNPTDELKKKIVALANTMREWNEKTTETRKSVRKQLNDIIDLGINKYKMQKTELRQLTEEILRYYGVSESWLRKLLPEGLKDKSKTRLSYLQKQEIEKERQRLLQHYPESRQRSETEEYSIPVVESSAYQQANLQTMPMFREDGESQKYESYQLPDTKTSDLVQGKTDDTNKKIIGLEAEIRRLSEPFVAKANLRALSEEVHVVAQIDPVEKVITWIKFDESISI